jgi:hypothetical protein
MTTTENALSRLVNVVREDESAIHALSIGEALAVALVLDRKDLLRGYSMLEAIEKLGPEWARATLVVQRHQPQPSVEIISDGTDRQRHEDCEARKPRHPRSEDLGFA